MRRISFASGNHEQSFSARRFRTRRLLPESGLFPPHVPAALLLYFRHSAAAVDLQLPFRKYESILCRFFPFLRLHGTRFQLFGRVLAAAFFRLFLFYFSSFNALDPRLESFFIKKRPRTISFSENSRTFVTN